MNNKEYFAVQDFLLEIEQIDYNVVLETLKPFIIYYVSSRAIRTYNLHREHKPKAIKKVSIPPELKIEYSDFDINNIVNEKYKESLIKFSKVMIENFSKEDLINFYNNINTLKTKHSTFKIINFILKRNFVGTYDSKKNEIVVDENGFSTSIDHELLHMASSVYKDGIRYSGFHQASFKAGLSSIGKGLNEGYTELLKRRYFGHDEDDECADSYEYEVKVADKLEQIVSKEKMESLYLKANLLGLIEELKQYTNDESEIMKFISDTDFILRHLDNKKLEISEKKLITNSLKDVNSFLIRTYSKKLLLQCEQNKITDEELSIKLVEYVSSLPQALKIKKNIYQLLSEEELRDCFVSVFGKENISISFGEEENPAVSKK